MTLAARDGDAEQRERRGSSNDVRAAASRSPRSSCRALAPRTTSTTTTPPPRRRRVASRRSRRSSGNLSRRAPRRRTEGQTWLGRSRVSPRPHGEVSPAARLAEVLKSGAVLSRRAQVGNFFCLSFVSRVKSRVDDPPRESASRKFATDFETIPSISLLPSSPLLGATARALVITESEFACNVAPFVTWRRAYAAPAHPFCRVLRSSERARRGGGRGGGVGCAAGRKTARDIIAPLFPSEI